MRRLTLLTRVYGPFRKKLMDTINSNITSMITELDVQIETITTGPRGYIEITLEGEDDEFVTNLLAQEYGQVLTSRQLEIGQVLSGQFVDVGKVGYGLYVNIGIVTPKRMDALVPLYLLREQTNMHEKPLRSIANTLVFVENLPTIVELLDIDLVNQKIEARLSKSMVERIEKWSKDDHERLLVLGVTRDMIESVLSRTDHQTDIYQVEELGIFEFSLRCKRSTRASGILSAIGSKLRGVPIHLFIPKEVEEKRNDKT